MTADTGYTEADFAPFTLDPSHRWDADDQCAGCRCHWIRDYDRASRPCRVLARIPGLPARWEPRGGRSTP